MRVLFASAEAYPLAKTGGLADVSAALPMALGAMGVDARLVLPGYPDAIAAAANKSIRYAADDFAGFGPIKIVSARTPDTGLPVWLVDCPGLFHRFGGLYQDETGKDWADNALRFALFSRAAAAIATGELVPEWHADVVHANDWHAGLLPAYLAAAGAKRVGTVFTIHNLAFQGVFPASFWPRLGLPDAFFSTNGLEYYGKLSFLKAGIRYSDQLTTVSPTYAREILTEEFGCGLYGILRARRDCLTGILNGVDSRAWDPATDPHLPANFSKGNIAGKRACKIALQQELNLQPASDVPLMIYISRITDQKMADVVLDALPAILGHGAQFALLGEGEAAFQRQFEQAARASPGRVSVRIGYDEPLAHRLHAGADILLHPSRFEPCGLTQLYAMRYGTVPIIRRIGGLADTVVDTDDQSLRDGTATGFAFDEPSSENFISCIERSLNLFRQPVRWRRIQRRAMAQDFGWESSARKYLKLYQRVAPNAAPEPETHDAEEMKRDFARKVTG